MFRHPMSAREFHPSHPESPPSDEEPTKRRQRSNTRWIVQLSQATGPADSQRMCLSRRFRQGDAFLALITSKHSPLSVLVVNLVPFGARQGRMEHRVLFFGLRVVDAGHRLPPSLSGLRRNAISRLRRPPPVGAETPRPSPVGAENAVQALYLEIRRGRVVGERPAQELRMR